MIDTNKEIHDLLLRDNKNNRCKRTQNNFTPNDSITSQNNLIIDRLGTHTVMSDAPNDSIILVDDAKLLCANVI